MNVSHDVITDLLPLYLAGEASSGTRALVEEYLRANPEFAADVRRQAEQTAALLGAMPVALPPDHEKAAFERTRRFNRHRTHVLGFAIAFSLLPFSFVWSDDIKWVMLQHSPKQGVMFWIAALGCWIAYVVMGRRLRHIVNRE